MEFEFMDDVLFTVQKYAEKAHGTQKRKYTPEPYIVHPIRVMNTCKAYTTDVSILAAALLHDVLEDTPVTKEELGNFLKENLSEVEAKRTLHYVIELTDVYVKRDYPQWNRRKRKSKELERLRSTSAASQTIKYADILDNASEIVAYDRSFGKVFLQECKTLLKELNKGNQMLYAKAIKMVEDQMALLNLL